MSRSGYSDDYDNWDLIRWRGAVASAIRGKRGQAMLRELLTALDALPEKRLAAGALQTADGEFCTLGALGRYRGIDMSNIDPEDRDAVAEAFGVADALTAEIMFENDEMVPTGKHVTITLCGPVRPGWPDYGQHRRTIYVENAITPEARWERMRGWVASHITAPTAERGGL